MYSAKIDLTEHLRTKAAVFVADPLMRKHAVLTMKHMGFTNVTDIEVPRNYFEALNRIVPVIAGNTELILLDLPPKPRPTGTREEMDTIYDQINENYYDLKSLLTQRKKADPLKLLSKTIPLVEVGDYLREKLIEVLAKYRVISAFFLTAPMEIKKTETPSRKEWKAKKNLELFFTEMSSYMNYYFRDRDELVTLVDDKLSEQDLNERKKQYDVLTAKADECKEKGDIDQAINLLRQAIEVFPQDIEAFLESGRLYTRKKEYGRALIRYGQAEELFQEAPEPNKEIGSMRMIQVKEKVQAGAAPDSPEIMELLEEALENYRSAISKATALENEFSGGKNTAQHDTVTAIAADILQSNLESLLGSNHPAVVELLGVVQDSTQKLDTLALNELSGHQCLALALRAWQQNEIGSAEMYYFQALKDGPVFSKACTEINKMGMRLRKIDLFDDALQVYEKLLKHDPPNAASVYWNMAVACAMKNDPLKAAGYAVQCLHLDPELAKEKEFYDSLTPQLVSVLIKLIKTLHLIQDNVKTVKSSPQLYKVHQARNGLVRLIEQNKRQEALKTFLILVTKASRYTVLPEFYGDGIVPDFARSIRDSLSANPKYKNNAVIIGKWLDHVSKRPVPPKMVTYLKLVHRAEEAAGREGRPDIAVAQLGKALIIMPDSYYLRPAFYVRKSLLSLVRELVYKFRYLNPDYFPKKLMKQPASNPKAEQIPPKTGPGPERPGKTGPPAAA